MNTLQKPNYAPSLLRPVGRATAQLRRYPVIPLFILGAFVLMAVFADWLAPHSPTTGPLRDRLTPPSGSRAEAPTTFWERTRWASTS